LQILKESLRQRSPRFWNRWRTHNPKVVPDLRGLWFAGGVARGFNLRRARLDGGRFERADLAGVHLEGASLRDAHFWHADLTNVRADGANLSGANLRGADLAHASFRDATALPRESRGTSFTHANLRQADFTSASMPEARLSDADLTQARFDRANLKGALFNDAILDGTSLVGADISGAHIYGAFVRRLAIDETTRQDGLFLDIHVWERNRAAPRRKQYGANLSAVEVVEVDDIQLAQFHNIVDEWGSVGRLLSATTKRVVLILGRFRPARKRVLNALAAALRRRGKVAVVFDFPSPQDREVSDTVRFIAGMSEFIVVDMTDASSVPLELQATIPDLMVPVLPIVKSGQPVFSMFSDLQRRYFWIQQPVSYDSAQQLVEHVDDGIIVRARQAAEEIRARRADSVRTAVNVARVESVVPRRRRSRSA
jgi:uncharacterized protein YjbI with pentapeptide repeats